MFDLKTKGQLKGTGMKIQVTDPTLGGGQMDIYMVYDNVTKQNWFVHQDGNKFYYLKNTDGNHSVMTIDSKTYEVKGGQFVEFETQNQIQGKLGVALADGMAKGLFGLAAIGAAVPAAANLGSTYLGSKFLNTTIDFSSQMIANGGDLNDINLTSLATSFVFNKTSSLQGLLLKNSIGQGLQYNTGGGYDGFFGEGVNNQNVLQNIGIGTLFDKGSSIVQSLNSNITPAMVGRWKNLSYKPKYNSKLKQYQNNRVIRNFLKSTTGQLSLGVLGNASSVGSNTNE